jgi:hypothetical protein
MENFANSGDGPLDRTMRHAPTALLFLACLMTFLWGLGWLWLLYLFLQWLI